MAKKKPKKISPEERAALEAQYEETTRLLEERMAYHRAKLKEEHGRDYEPPTLDEYEANLRQRIASRRREAS